MFPEEKYFELFLTFHGHQCDVDSEDFNKLQSEYIRGLEVVQERQRGITRKLYPQLGMKNSLDIIYYIRANSFLQSIKKTGYQLVKNSTSIKEYRLGGKILSYFYKYVWLAFVIAFTFNTVFFNTSSIVVNAAVNSNPIKLNVPFVQIGDKKIETKYNNNYEWEYNGDLGEGDLIRYGWNAVAIDLSYKNYPQVGAGWIQVYLNDDSNIENLISENGTSPLAISKISKKLVPGKNKIMLVYVNETNNPLNSTSKTTLTFGYKSNEAKTPKISNIPEPSTNTLFLEGVTRNFKIELNNFELTNSSVNTENKGQLKLYLDKVEGKPLATIKSSKLIDLNRQLVEFSSKDFDPEIEIPDNKETKLIFILANNSGENSNIVFERNVTMNFQGTLQDIGLPEIKITEPKIDSTDLNVQGDTKFIVETRNFDILAQLTDTVNEDKKGYMQIYINDIPIKTLWPKRDFTLDEIGFNNELSGKKTVQVQLVNKDYTILNPAVKSSVIINYIAKNNLNKTLISGTNQLNQNEKNQPANSRDESNNWRIIVISLIASLIIASILILVFKG